MWIARNKSGKLRLFAKKPIRNNDAWLSDGKSAYLNKKQKVISEYFNIILYSEQFDSLTWENEPWEIKLDLEANNKYDKSKIYLARDKVIRHPAHTNLNAYNIQPFKVSGCDQWWSSNYSSWSVECIIDISDDNLGLTIDYNDFNDLKWENTPLRLRVNYYVDSEK